MTASIAPTASVAEARALGRALRERVGRRSHGASVARDRDAVAILESQHPSRLADLVPVRIGRMLQSPFSFYRGSAAVMAHDMAAETRTGHHLTMCGDAHVSNFGLFASPERRVLFDLNDFDEAAVGPWEWDVKRMAASVVLAARSEGATAEQTTDATLRAVARYRTSMAQFAEMSAIERYYLRIETDRLKALASDEDRATVQRSVRKATRRTSERLLTRMTAVTEDGIRHIVEQPPIAVRVKHGTLATFTKQWNSYRSTVRPDIGLLLSQFRLVDYILRVVGVGSVGTRCYVLLFEGPHGEPLFLQVKEAQMSVIYAYGGIAPTSPPGVASVDTGVAAYRVVTGQRILQAQSDPFLGWHTGVAGERRTRRPVDYYWRQFRDMKGSFDLEALTPAQLATYAELCAAVLARAHSQSPHPAVIAAYLGRSDAFDQAITTWAIEYADQAERDFASLERAVASGRLPALRDT